MCNSIFFILLKKIRKYFHLNKEEKIFKYEMKMRKQFCLVEWIKIDKNKIKPCWFIYFFFTVVTHFLVLKFYGTF